MNLKRLVVVLAVSILIMTAQAVFAGDLSDAEENISVWVILRVVIGAVVGFMTGGIFGAIVGALFMFFVNPCENVPHLPIVY